jgi:hypothetical protein
MKFMSQLNQDTETKIQDIHKLKNSQNSYIQMSNLISGNTGSNFINNCNRSSFRLYSKNNPVNNASDIPAFNNTSSLTKTTPPFGTLDEAGFVDDLVSTAQTSTLVKDLNNVDLPNNNAVYNFPWDFKLKSNSVLQVPTSQLVCTSTKQSCIQKDPVTNNLMSSSSSIPPPLPTVPPPQTIRQLENLDDLIEISNSQLIENKAENFQLSNSINEMSDLDIESQCESQYCAPWDLKIQEEMLKMMTQKQQNRSKNIIKTFNGDKDLNIIDKTDHNISSKSDNLKYNTQNCAPNQTENLTISDKSIQSDEYSLPWEHKQSLLLQNLVSGASLKQFSTFSQSINSTLTHNSTKTVKNCQNFTSQATNHNKLSPRASSSSSSSTHSSTSSLSANLHTSMPSLPLPPTMPPPPPPPTILPIQITNNSLLTSVSAKNHQSPRLSQKQPIQNQINSCNFNSNLVSSSQINSFNILPNNNNTSNKNSNTNLLQLNSSNVSLMNQNSSIIVNNPQSLNSCIDQNYLTEKNKFASWGSNNSSNINSLDTATVNSIDGEKNFFRISTF